MNENGTNGADNADPFEAALKIADGCRIALRLAEERMRTAIRSGSDAERDLAAKEASEARVRYRIASRIVAEIESGHA